MKNKKKISLLIVFLGIVTFSLIIWKVGYSKTPKTYSPIMSTNQALKQLLPILEEFYKKENRQINDVDINKSFATIVEEQTNQLFVWKNPKTLSEEDIAIWLLLPKKLDVDKKITIIAYARDIYYFRHKPPRTYITAILHCQGKFKIYPVLPGDISNFYPDIENNSEKANLYYITKRLNLKNRPGYKPTHIPGPVEKDGESGSKRVYYPVKD